MPKPEGSPRRKSEEPPKDIDRLVQGVRGGRITIRATKLSHEARKGLNDGITRAIEKGELEALTLLRERKVTPIEFLAAYREGRLASLKAGSQLAPLVDEWLAVSDLRRSTKARYTQSWRFLYASLPKHPALDDLTTRWWTRFVATRLGIVNAATINRDRAALLSFYGWAREQGYRLPQLTPQKHTEEPARSEILTPQQVRAIRQHCRPDQWPFFWALLETGARQGEVLNLKGSDVDKTRPVLRFLPQDGSKGKKERKVRVDADLHNYLLTIATLVGNGRIFDFNRWQAQRWWTDLCRALGIQGVTLHGLRATFITNALDKGVPSIQVRDQVGHSTILMTERYYRSPQDGADVADRVRIAMGLADPEPGETKGGVDRIAEEATDSPVPAIPTAPATNSRLDKLG